MSAPRRAVAFGVALLALFAAAFGIGTIFDGDAAAEGYHLRLGSTALTSGHQVPVSFRVVDADGAAVTRFAVRHTKKLHLVAVSHDFSRFRHVHPTMAADGTWTARLDLDAGPWRLFADFRPEGGTKQVLHRDVSVTGGPVTTTDVEPHSLAGVDGFEVEAVGELTAGGTGSMLEFEVRRNGRPVTDLEPYLGAYGHLVVLRETDMKYLHVHPEEGRPDPRIAFHVEVPTAGTYYLYLDFQVDGVVHTAPVVLGAAGHDSGDMGGMDHGDH